MARLPVPGSDDGTWGDVLNDFLSQSHTGAGALKPDSVGNSQLQDDAVNASSIADGSITNAHIAANAAISADKLTDGSTNKVMTAAERSKLAGLSANTPLAFIEHGSNAAAARPTGADRVLWIGTVQPVNLAAGDLYFQATPAPWTPLSLSGLQGWYDPSALGLSNGASLTGWTDQSSHLRSLSVNGEAPVYSAAGLNGKPAVSFSTGTVGTLDSATFGAAVTGPVTFFINFQANDLTAIRNLIGGASATDISVQLRSTGAGYTIRRTDIDLTVNNTLTTGTAHGLTVVFNGASTGVYLDGSLISSGTVGTDPIPRLRVGRRGDGQNRYQGLIGDVFWATGIPDTNTLAQAHAWLQARRNP